MINNVPIQLREHDFGFDYKHLSESVMRAATTLSAMLVLAALLFSSAVDARSLRIELRLSLNEDNGLQICLCGADDVAKSEGVQLTAVTVDDPSAPQAQALWALYAGQGDFYPVKCFRYGEAAGGLNETVAPTHLEVQHIYRIAVMSVGRHGQAFFRILEEDGSRTLEVLKQLPDE